MLPLMCKPRPALFKWRHFEPAIITCAVGWYLRFSLSYRDVEELLTERGLPADHTTIWRWVQCYAPELNTLPSGTEACQPLLEGG
jgi:transposase-like protein